MKFLKEEIIAKSSSTTYPTVGCGRRIFKRKLLFKVFQNFDSNSESVLFVCLAEPCTTEDGVKCLMPFQYNGVTYSGCTAVDDTRPWCFTVNGNNDYGYCSKSCVTGWFTKSIV